MLNLLKIEYIMKRKLSELYYRYKRNELPKYLESMFIHTILDISLFYINYQQRQALGGYVSDNIYQNYLPKHLNV